MPDAGDSKKSKSLDLAAELGFDAGREAEYTALSEPDGWGSANRLALAGDWIDQPGVSPLTYEAGEGLMLKTGILNPHLNSLLARVRHTNMLVIADRGFPFWPSIETVDISLVDDVPTVLEVLRALRPNFQIGKAWMAQEFLRHNSAKTRAAFSVALRGIALSYEPHPELKQRVPQAIGLIRTGDTVPYANMVLESA